MNGRQAEDRHAGSARVMGVPMIELRDNKLLFSFPDVHPHCKLEVEFQRTLRIPDDGRDYPLPPGLGRFSVAHIDDHAERVPANWRKRGGVMLPMFATEAMWLKFHCPEVPGHGVGWPFALKVAAGKINAVDGELWSEPLAATQDWLSLPTQPWLDGFFAEKGLIRQFVAMQLGRGYTVEEQLTGSGEHGGAQLIAMPMKRAAFLARFPKQPPMADEYRYSQLMSEPMPCAPMSAAPDLGLAAGGRMKQAIYDDPFGADAYDPSQHSRCFVHLCDAMVWQSLTGAAPPHPAPTARDYSKAGLPWFDYSSDAAARDSSGWLDKVKSVAAFAKGKNETALAENDSTTPQLVVPLAAGQVREGEF